MGVVTNLKYKDDDGNDDNFSIDQVRIREVTNGWIVEEIYDGDGGEYTHVFTHADEMWNFLKRTFKI